LVYDGVQLLAKALHDMGRSQEVTPKSFSCDGIDSWAQGNNLINFIKTVRRVEGCRSNKMRNSLFPKNEVLVHVFGRLK
jgi:Receptor family ligand binding region